MAEYIEREALISEIKTLPEQERIEYMGIYDCIRSQHTADLAEVRHGKWTISEYEYLNCSECGHMHYTGMDSIKQAEQNLLDGEVPNYCPNCGAKMDK